MAHSLVGVPISKFLCIVASKFTNCFAVDRYSLGIAANSSLMCAFTSAPYFRLLKKLNMAARSQLRQHPSSRSCPLLKIFPLRSQHRRCSLLEALDCTPQIRTLAAHLE